VQFYRLVSSFPLVNTCFQCLQAQKQPGHRQKKLVKVSGFNYFKRLYSNYKQGGICETMKSKTQPIDWQILLGVFLVGFACLMLELIQVRMLSFFLGGISNFLAIPIALLGLALGSLFCHFFYKGNSNSLIGLFSVLVFPVTIATFIAFFYITNNYFSEIHVVLHGPGKETSKFFIYTALFIPPYFLFGALLASYFATNSTRIGLLYFFDLVGAALACLVTPLLFTYTDLPPALMILFFSALVLLLNARVRYKLAIASVAVSVFVLVQSLTYGGVLFKEYPEPSVLARSILKDRYLDTGIEELSVRWNEIARTSLLRSHAFEQPLDLPRATVVVQDDGMSNVWFTRYITTPNRQSLINSQLHYAIPQLIGKEPKDILVMFAGTGRDMVLLDAIANGQANITGVELNRTVVDLVNHPATDNMNLKAFFRRDNINLVNREGRDFLNHVNWKYDLIFAATNGAVAANRVGHTRKYLDTYEAMAAYLDALDDDGMMIFVNQPVKKKILSFKKLFKERGLKRFKKSLLVFCVKNSENLKSLVVKPGGFSRKEVKTLTARIAHKEQLILYEPYKASVQSIESLVNASPQELAQGMVVDDKPFIREVAWTDFSIFPDKNRIRQPDYASNWIKLFTVFAFGLISILVIVAARFLGGSEQRLPLLWLLYFFFSGIAYMFVEIGLIAKTELFMGNPLYAVAVILAMFLASNAIGAMLQDRFHIMRGPITMIVVTIISVVWGVFAVNTCNSYFLSMSLFLKILGVAIAVAPSGIALGAFYPLGVDTLVRNGYEKTVPATYAIATLSSVLGSAIAMTAITNLGFSKIILLGAAGYTIVAGIFLAARRLTT
jgi:hypothetical protein